MNNTVRTPQRYERLLEKGRYYIRLLGVEPDSPPFPDSTLIQSESDTIQQWCQEHDCGVRMSFDMWNFRNEKELTAFVLRWC